MDRDGQPVYADREGEFAGFVISPDGKIAYIIASEGTTPVTLDDGTKLFLKPCRDPQKLGDFIAAWIACPQDKTETTLQELNGFLDIFTNPKKILDLFGKDEKAKDDFLKNIDRMS